jgi:hypothetical protein
MDPYMMPFIVRDALLCLLFLVGIIAGGLAISRNQGRIGALVIAGFLLLGIDPLSEFIIFNFVSTSLGDSVDFAAFNWAYVCVSGFADIVGFLALIAAIYLAVQAVQKGNTGSNEEISYTPNP